MLCAAIGWIPFGLFYPLMPSAPLALVLIFPAIVMTSMPYGCAAAAIQEMMPPRMRGFASALMLSANGIIGMGIGPFIVARVTDGIFADESALRYSLAYVCTGIHVIAVFFLILALRNYRQALDSCRNYETKE